MHFCNGGIPDEFRSLVLRAVTDAYGIEPSQLFFPEDGLNLRTEGKIYWFSDQVEVYMHPAQMAHHRSIDVIKKISERIPIAGDQSERLYISRGDTGRRRVANEEQVYQELRDYDFELIRLADHPVERQISLIRGAKQIVAPHGMGLTHLAFHHGQPRVLELFNRQRGGDDYALMSKAMGFSYQFLLGEPVENGLDDFTVPPESIVAILDQSGVARSTGTGQQRHRNLIPAAKTFAGTWSPGVQLEESAVLSSDVPALLPGNAVMRHVRRSPDTRPGSNCGAWWGIAVDPGQTYTATCWVWVPAKFEGKQVGLSLGEWGRQQRSTADLSKRDSWQRLRSTAIAPPDVTHCAIVMRVVGPDGSAVYSTCWQLEAGLEPSDYEPTGPLTPAVKS